MDIKHLINTCCGFRKTTNKELAIKTSQTPQNFNHKMQRNDMKISELETIINGLDCHIELSVITNDTNESIFQVRIPQK